MFYFNHYLGKIPILTNILQLGWNHQPDIVHRWISTGVCHFSDRDFLHVLRLILSKLLKAIIVDHHMILLEPCCILVMCLIYIYIHILYYLVSNHHLLYTSLTPFYVSAFLCLQDFHQGASDESDPPARRLSGAPFRGEFCWRNKTYFPEIWHVDISENGWFSPQIIHLNRVYHYKPSILGYLYFWKHPHGTWKWWVSKRSF